MVRKRKRLRQKESDSETETDSTETTSKVSKKRKKKETIKVESIKQRKKNEPESSGLRFQPHACLRAKHGGTVHSFKAPGVKVSEQSNAAVGDGWAADWVFMVGSFKFW